MSRTRSMRLRATTALFFGLLAIGAVGRVNSVSRVLAHGGFEVEASFAGKEFVKPDERIEFHLSRALAPDEGSPAVFIGDTDITQLLAKAEKTLSYTPRLLPLPAGATQVRFFLVSPAGEWKQVAEFLLRVDTQKQQVAPATESSPVAQRAKDGKNGSWGFDTFEFKPSLTINVKAQSAVLFFPTTNRPDRINFLDFALQGNVQSNFKRGAVSSQSQFDFVGTSNQREALRFGDRGMNAPQFDLSSYLTQFQLGKVKVTLGHSSYGSNRYLINSFSSRGVTVTVPVGKRADFSLTAMNGTSIVGWNNFFGVNRQKHQILSGTLGLELLKKRPGALRVELGLLRGSLLPLTNFNQNNLTDAERSYGLGFRVVATDAAQRLRLDVGYGRSRFGNPADPFLNRGFNVVPVRETAKNARYLDVSYQVLKDVALTKEKKVNLSFTFRHNRVDPLFRSVAASAQADRLDNQLEVSGNVGEVNAAASYNGANDNLDDIRSILKTLSRRSGFQINGPSTALFGKPSSFSKWLPKLAYTLDRTHAFGAFLPVGGGFSDSHVPDQASTNQSFSADWQFTRFRFGYRLNQSFQDNRQTGRQNADFRNLINSFSGGWTPHRRFNLNIDLSSERARSIETGRLDNALRAGFSFNLETTKKSTLSATVSSAFAGDAANTNRSRNADLDLQWSWRFGVEKDHYRKVQGQFFARYANRYASARDNLFFFNNLTKVQTMSAGLSFTFF